MCFYLLISYWRLFFVFRSAVYVRGFNQTVSVTYHHNNLFIFNWFYQQKKNALMQKNYFKTWNKKHCRGVNQSQIPGVQTLRESLPSSKNITQTAAANEKLTINSIVWWIQRITLQPAFFRVAHPDFPGWRSEKPGNSGLDGTVPEKSGLQIMKIDRKMKQILKGKSKNSKIFAPAAGSERKGARKHWFSNLALEKSGLPQNKLKNTGHTVSRGSSQMSLNSL